MTGAVLFLVVRKYFVAHELLEFFVIGFLEQLPASLIDLGAGRYSHPMEVVSIIIWRPHGLSGLGLRYFIQKKRESHTCCPSRFQRPSHCPVSWTDKRAEASRRLWYTLDCWRSRVNKSDILIHIGIYCLSQTLTNLRKLRSFWKQGCASVNAFHYVADTNCRVHITTGQHQYSPRPRLLLGGRCRKVNY